MICSVMLKTIDTTSRYMQDAYPVGNIFCSLVHLTVCICQTEWLNVLIRVLRDSPNLKTLIIQEVLYIHIFHFIHSLCLIRLFLKSTISIWLIWCAILVSQNHHIRAGEPRPCWNKTRLVPEYLLPSLETFEWVYYEGTETDKEVVAFILRIASSLKQATIKSSKSIDHDKKLEMLKDFPVSSRRSPACLLAFFWNLRSEF